MNLSEKEKQERHRQASRRYYAKLRAKNDTKAIARHRYLSDFSTARGFIRKAKKADLPTLRDLIAERQKELYKKTKKYK